MNKRNSKGFTLIELIIAIAISSIVALSGYTIINKTNMFTKSQQNITNNQAVSNLVNNYLSQDIEQSTKISEKISEDENNYKYNIDTTNGTVEYKVVLSKKKNKLVYSLSRNKNSKKIEVIQGQTTNDKDPFIIVPKEDGTYNINIIYSENGMIKKYSFATCSRIKKQEDIDDSGENTKPDKDNSTSQIIKPKEEDIPEIPSYIGANTHYIGFWTANSQVQKENNICTWIDKNYKFGTFTKEKNDIRAEIKPSTNNSLEYSSIENTRVEGIITERSNMKTMGIYVSKGTTVEDLQIKTNQGCIYIDTSERISENLQTKVNLSGGATDGKWYKCKVSGNIDRFEVTSGSLSINKNIVESGFVLIVYGDEVQELGDVHIIFEYERTLYEPMNPNQYNLKNTIKTKSSSTSYQIATEHNDNAFSESIQSYMMFDNDRYNITLRTEKSYDKKVNYINGVNIANIKKAILVLQGNVSLENTNGLTEIIPNKQYELKVEPGTNFDKHVRISNLNKGEKGYLKVYLVE